MTTRITTLLWLSIPEGRTEKRFRISMNTHGESVHFHKSFGDVGFQKMCLFTFLPSQIRKMTFYIILAKYKGCSTRKSVTGGHKGQS